MSSPEGMGVGETAGPGQEIARPDLERQKGDFTGIVIEPGELTVGKTADGYLGDEDKPKKDPKDFSEEEFGEHKSDLLPQGPDDFLTGGAS